MTSRTGKHLIKNTHITEYRRSKKVFLEISQNNIFHRKIISEPESLLFKLQTLACNFIKKETLAQVFFAKFLRTFFLTEHLRWLLLPILPNFPQNLNSLQYLVFIILLLLQVYVTCVEF